MPVSQILHDIKTIEKNLSLYHAINFDERADAIDQLEFLIIDLFQQPHHSDDLLQIIHQAEKIKTDLEAINDDLFKQIRINIKEEKLKDLVNRYINLDLTNNQETVGYDNLDVFINGLFPPHIPEPTKNLEPEMVFYQKTPARVVFELTEKIKFTPDDVFIDIGSGLGQVPVLVNLLTGIAARGIEYEPTFVTYANACVAELNLPNVSFINTDARQADYSIGTIFFMFTPFKGDILQQVLSLLQKEAQHRKITLLTYGPCTVQVALQSWLRCEEPGHNSNYKLGVFTSGIN
jgi:hypothetical protein